MSKGLGKGFNLFPRLCFRQYPDLPDGLYLLTELLKSFLFVFSHKLAIRENYASESRRYNRPLAIPSYLRRARHRNR